MGFIAVAAGENSVENEFAENLPGVFAHEFETGGLFDRATRADDQDDAPLAFGNRVQKVGWHIGFGCGRHGPPS